ncbi:MAG TPA: hypothetical protein VKU35_00870 [Candidatus Limnocylindria bacterium]|nr:hypothetical protein [Candidatus Limnocylindria bacterium]
MSDLEHVDLTSQAAVDQEGLDRGLRITGEQCAEPPEAEQPHDRGVVDVTLEQGSGRIAG